MTTKDEAKARLFEVIDKEAAFLCSVDGQERDEAAEIIGEAIDAYAAACQPKTLEMLEALAADADSVILNRDEFGNGLEVWHAEDDGRLLYAIRDGEGTNPACSRDEVAAECERIAVDLNDCGRPMRGGDRPESA